jgi:tRNA G18 (ribose-2'-O)-methylase SpoU
VSESIERADDPRLEAYARVGDHRWLEERGLFVAEGRLVVERVVADGRYLVESVLVTPAALRALESRLGSASPIYVVEQALLEGTTGFNFHRGCLALVRRPTVDAQLAEFGAARRLVVLEGVGNPDNIGGIFRSAAALGAGGVLLDRSSGDPLYRKAVRTSMGAVLRLPFARVDPWPQSLGTLRQMGFVIGALTPAGTLTLGEFRATLSPSARVALLAGAEGPGLSAAALAESDTTVRIPVDPRSDSLNVVVAVSIALEHLARGAVGADLAQ